MGAAYHDKARDSGSESYWRFRKYVELLKLGSWIAWQWIKSNYPDNV